MTARTRRRPGPLAVLAITVSFLAVITAAQPATSATAPPVHGIAQTNTLAAKRVPPPSAWYEIVIRHSTMCVSATSGVEGAVLVQRQCTQAGSYAHWGLIWTSGGFAKFQNRESDLCINVEGGSTANYAWIIQYKCDPEQPWVRNDEWKGEPKTSDGFSHLRPAHAINHNKCLAVEYASRHAYAPLIQHTCTRNDTPNDEITFVRVWV